MPSDTDSTDADDDDDVAAKNDISFVWISINFKLDLQYSNGFHGRLHLKSSECSEDAVLLIQKIPTHTSVHIIAGEIQISI